MCKNLHFSWPTLLVQWRFCLYSATLDRHARSRRACPYSLCRGGHLFPPFCHTCMPVAGIHLKNAQDGFPITNVGNDEEDKSSTKDVGNDEEDRFPIKNVENDNLTLSSPQGVGGDPSSQCQSPERFRMKMPGVTERSSFIFRNKKVYSLSDTVWEVKRTFYKLYLYQLECRGMEQFLNGKLPLSQPLFIGILE